MPEKNKPEEKPVKEKKEKSKLMKSLTKSVGNVDEMDIILTIRHLSLMLQAGISLPEAIEALDKLAQDKALKKVYREILESVTSGMSLADSMRQHPKIFKGVITPVVEVGEDTGTLETNLKFLADYLKKQYELRRKIQGAMLYPIIVLTISVAEMIGVLFFILPKLDTLFESFPNRPPTTTFILNAAGYIRSNFLIIVAVIAVVGFALSYFFKTKTGSRVFARISINFPIINKLVRFNIYANFTRTLSILMNTGMPLSKSIKITGMSMDNPIYKDAIVNDVYKSFKEGNDLATSLKQHHNLFPESFFILVESGEKSGTLKENLEFAYNFYTDEATDMVENLTDLLEPIMLVMIGIMIGLLAVAIIVPMYQLLGTINT